MNKKEAIIAMQNGLAVIHDSFDDSEFIYMKDGVIYDENGYKMELEGPGGTVIDFWTDRKGPYWESGWSIKPKVPTPYPQFLIGLSGNALRLMNISKGVAKYFRDGGHYDVTVNKEGDKFIGVIDITESSFELIECDYETWLKDNSPYGNHIKFKGINDSEDEGDTQDDLPY